MNCFAHHIGGHLKLMFAKPNVRKNRFVVILERLTTHGENVSIRDHRYFFVLRNSGVAEVCGALSEVGGLGPLAPMSS